MDSDRIVQPKASSYMMLILSDADVDVDVDQAFRDQVQRAEAAGRATDKHCPPLQRGCPIHRGGARKWR